MTMRANRLAGNVIECFPNRSFVISDSYAAVIATTSAEFNYRLVDQRRDSVFLLFKDRGGSAIRWPIRQGQGCPDATVFPGSSVGRASGC